MFTQKTFQCVFGAALAVFCGWLLWGTALGGPWVNASYDYLFRFGARPVTNDVALVLMDNEAYDHFHQTRGQPWDRGLHAQLLNKLADDGCRLVVIDSFFGTLRDPAKDQALADAMHRQRHIVLMAEQARITAPGVTGARPVLPADLFLNAAGTNWGVAWLDRDPDSIVRRQWPFPSPGPYPSLPWAAAMICGVSLDPTPQERWLRYYGRNGDWPVMSYAFALTEPTNYFRDKIVFVGVEPGTSYPDGEPDEFQSPYWRWTDETTGGVEIMLTSFLNLLNGDWMQRPPAGIEFLILTGMGILLGWLSAMRTGKAMVLVVATGVVVSITAIVVSYFTHYWFPWLVIAGGQAPCALAWMAVINIRRGVRQAVEKPPKIPGHKLFHPPFGAGAYGNVWLAKGDDGQWRAVKIIYLKKFDNNASPYEREFNGVNRYQPVSDKHPGLLRVDFVSDKLDGYFYYVMELGDALEPDWQRDPKKYKPRDLANERKRQPGGRIPLPECVRVGLALTEALEFLHQQGLTHRDIKPQNVIYVDGRVKLADLGLIAEIRPPDKTRTFVGTPGYLPPPPELPGTPQADIYALGMLLYVISTGRGAGAFPEIATTLLDPNVPSGFLSLNMIILKACQPDLNSRYKTAAEMSHALEQLRK
jgi:CHASE2 domain-containing sensor protein